MKKLATNFFIFCTALMFCAPCSFAQDPAMQSSADDSAKPKSTRAKMLTGTPVNVNIAGGGSLPKGKLLTIYNSSFADKTSREDGYRGPKVFSQTHILKLRYGLTNHWELSSVGGYANNERRGGNPSPRHIEGMLDQSLGLTYSPFQFHQGDKFALSFTGAVTTPTGQYGKNHLPGGGVWGGRLAAGVATFLTKDIRFDTEAVWIMPFERGNQDVKRGDQYQWNTQLRYLFDKVDIGLESTLIHTESGDKNINGRNVNMKNGITEWYVGPSVNLAIDSLDMWVGVGAFFPVVQDVKGPNIVEDVRYEFKIAKMW